MGNASIGISVTIPTAEGVAVKIGGSVNVYQAAAAGVHLVQGIGGLITDTISNMFN